MARTTTTIMSAPDSSSPSATRGATDGGAKDVLGGRSTFGEEDGGMAVESLPSEEDSLAERLIDTSQSSLAYMRAESMSPVDDEMTEERAVGVDGERGGKGAGQRMDDGPAEVVKADGLEGGVGQKRTASGTVKLASPSLPTSPVDGHLSGHSRHTSSISNGAPMSELSSQLRARLSYAKFKVEKGWENRTITELESLASHAASPPSTTPSPRRPASAHALLHSSNFPHALPRPLLSPPIHCTPHGPRSPHRRTLAPPATFHARSRRAHGPTPSLDTALSATAASASSASSPAIVPSTPPPLSTPGHQRAAGLKTPSQRASAQEQEAVETLLFMSSPGGAQQQQPWPVPTEALSPWREGFGGVKPGTRSGGVNGMAVMSGYGAGNVMARPGVGPKGVLHGVLLQSEAAIDRVLDEMDDEADSSEEEEHGMVDVEARARAIIF